MHLGGKKLIFCFSLGLFLLVGGWVQAQTTVFLSPTEAIKLIFQDSQEVYQEKKTLDADLQRKAQEILGYTVPETTLNFYVGKTNGKVDGYALIDHQVGKVMPITFITRINPEGKVEDVEIMVYRESHGGEVKSKRFLNQFKDKTWESPIQIQRDIVNISGATLSSRALTVGVKRALVLWKLFYEPDQTQNAKLQP